MGCLAPLAGCAPGANDELRSLVEEVSLPGASSYDCEWGSSGFESEPESWYGCWQYVPDSLSHLSGVVRDRLSAGGFAVRIDAGSDPHAVQFTATRGAHVVCVDLLEPGFVHGRNTAPHEVNPSPGDVFVDIWTVNPRPTSSLRCSALPAWPDE